MTVLLLIRHSHTDAAGTRLTGWARGVHLNARGREEAARLVERLEGVPIAAIYSSPLERCRETAAPLASARGLPVHARRGLIEVDYGTWTGRSIVQARRTKLWRTVQQAPSMVRFPGGESLLEVQGRAVAELDAIAAAHPRGTVAVVSHADVIRLLVAHLAGTHADHLQRLIVDPGSISVVALGDRIPRLVKLNDTGDLASLRPRRRPRPKVRG
ncbi:MAG TPA: MSMEG_4193 family putative phosphomutase [Actinomycetota bacterium]|nr:MSMEG_4193 family putative phosphomutase [Actinomycetota bacterium]